MARRVLGSLPQLRKALEVGREGQVRVTDAQQLDAAARCIVGTAAPPSHRLARKKDSRPARTRRSPQEGLDEALAPLRTAHQSRRSRKRLRGRMEKAQPPAMTAHPKNQQESAVARAPLHRGPGPRLPQPRRWTRTPCWPEQMELGTLELRSVLLDSACDRRPAQPQPRPAPQRPTQRARSSLGESVGGSGHEPLPTLAGLTSASPGLAGPEPRPRIRNGNEALGPRAGASLRTGGRSLQRSATTMSSAELSTCSSASGA